MQRTQRHMKKCSTSSDLTPARMATINKSTNNKCWGGCGANRTPVHYWWKCRLVWPLWKAVWSVLKKLKIKMPFDPAILLLGIYLNDPETPIWKNRCIPVSIAVLLTIAKIWKQPKCPSVDEWIKKAVIHLHSALQHGHKKEGNLTICNIMDGPGEHYAKWNTPARKRQNT